MPGGVNSPVRAFKSVGGKPLFMERGEGSHLKDVDGNEFIDYCMSWGPLILGHADPDVTEAVISAAERGTSFGTPSRQEVEIAEMVTDRFPSIEVIRFVNSGTEATMSAIRLARGVTGRDRIVKFDGCYHGHSDQLLVAGGSGLATLGTPDSGGVTADSVRDTIVAPFNNPDALETLFKERGNEIAALIMEPVPCNYGLVPPDPLFLKRVRALCTQYSVLLIFDEVITGLRLSRGGAQEYFSVMPDITTLGKIIGGGLPVGAYGASRSIMKAVAPDGPVYQAGTLSGNPVAMTAGIETMKKLDRTGAYELLRKKADTFRHMLQPALDKYSKRVLFLQCESIFSFYFTEREIIESVDHVREADMGLFARFHAQMLERGIYLSPSGYEVGFLSTAHTVEDIERTAQAVSESLDAVLG